MPRADKAAFIQGILSEHQLRQQRDAQKPAPDSKEWWRDVAQGLGVELAALRATVAEQAATITRLTREKEAAWDSAEYNARRAEQAEAERDALTARVGRLQARVDALFSAASLGRAALGRHDRWCGHSRNAPGDAIIHQAERALTEALDPSRCLDCGTLDYIDGRAHYEDGIRCMACATVAALKEQP